MGARKGSAIQFTGILEQIKRVVFTNVTIYFLLEKECI